MSAAPSLATYSKTGPSLLPNEPGRPHASQKQEPSPLPLSRAALELLLHQVSQIRLQLFAAQIERSRDFRPRHVRVRPQHRRFILERRLITGVDEAVREAFILAPGKGA